jgi:hypothetical protein
LVDAAAHSNQLELSIPQQMNGIMNVQMIVSGACILKKIKNKKQKSSKPKLNRFNVEPGFSLCRNFMF